MGVMLVAGATALNLQSSRSHAIFTIFLQRTMLEPVSERKQVSYCCQDLSVLLPHCSPPASTYNKQFDGWNCPAAKIAAACHAEAHQQLQAGETPCQHLWNSWLTAIAAGSNHPTQQEHCL